MATAVESIVPTTGSSVVVRCTWAPEDVEYRRGVVVDDSAPRGGFVVEFLNGTRASFDALGRCGRMRILA